ncbi:hypothetical protein EDD22DRAFT_955598 [Suillus occidentalis]|nr:hypothetical protein EDD22DRAFT_955598 [Suillus occidentalis]
MSSDTDSNSSIDSRPSGFNDGAEAILKNTTSKTRKAGKDDHRSRSPTPQCHKDVCPGPGQAHGQQAPVYSCGCYRYKHFTDRYRMEPGEDGELCLKRKRSQYDWYNAMDSFNQDIANGEKALQKHAKLTKRFKYLANKVVDMQEATIRLEAAIGRQSTILKEVCNALENNGM